MKIAEIVSPETRLFAKSEFGPASDRWPALSFSSHKIATDFANAYRRGRDFVVYVGTSDPEKTELPEHRQRLLSILSVEPRAPISTRDLVPADTWERTIRRWGVRWEWSLPIVATYDVLSVPPAHDTMPQTYRSLGDLRNLGRCVPVQQTEYQILFDLDVVPVALHISERAQVVLSLNTDNRALRDEITRLIDLIKHDIAVAGVAQTGVNPTRFMPNDSHLFSVLMRRWETQTACARCATDRSR